MIKRKTNKNPHYQKRLETVPKYQVKNCKNRGQIDLTHI